MLTVKGIYENGQIRLLEDIPSISRAEVIITILESDTHQISPETDNQHLFDDLIGAVSLRENGSVQHDHYLSIQTDT